MDAETQNQTSAGLTVRWLDHIDQVDAMTWNGLFPGANPFVRHEFLHALEASGSASPETGWQPMHLLLEHSGRPVAAMPLYLKGHSMGEFVFDHAWARAYERTLGPWYPKLLTAIPFAPVSGARMGFEQGADRSQLAARLLAEVRQRALESGWSGWHLLFPDAVAAATLRNADTTSELCWREDVQFHWHNRGYASFGDFLGDLRAARRKNLKRERRRVVEQGLRIERCLGSEAGPEEWQALQVCYEQTFLKRSGHPGYLVPEFFARLRVTLGEQTLLTLARKDGAVVAAALFFFDADTLYGRWWGSLIEADCLHFELCFYQGIEFAIERGLKRFDPGTQGEHKLLRGFEPVAVHSAHWLAEPGFRQAIQNFLVQEREHVHAYARHAAEFLPFHRAHRGPEES